MSRESRSFRNTAPRVTPSKHAQLVNLSEPKGKRETNFERILQPLQGTKNIDTSDEIRGNTLRIDVPWLPDADDEDWRCKLAAMNPKRRQTQWNKQSNKSMRVFEALAFSSRSSPFADVRGWMSSNFYVETFRFSFICG